MKKWHLPACNSVTLDYKPLMNIELFKAQWYFQSLFRDWKCKNSENASISGPPKLMLCILLGIQYSLDCISTANFHNFYIHTQEVPIVYSKLYAIHVLRCSTRCFSVLSYSYQKRVFECFSRAESLTPFYVPQKKLLKVWSIQVRVSQLLLSSTCHSAWL